MTQGQVGVTEVADVVRTALRVDLFVCDGTSRSRIRSSCSAPGTPQPHRTRRRAHHPVPAACQALAVCWYATAGYHPADTAARRRLAPWYSAKTEPSTADMTAKLRRVLIAARFKRTSADQAKPEEIHAIRLAWGNAGDLAA